MNRRTPEGRPTSVQATFMGRAGIGFLLFLIALPAACSVFTFTGDASFKHTPPDPIPNWFDPGNWSLGQIPGPGDTVVIDGMGVYVDHDVTLGGLTFKGTLTGPGAVTVTGAAHWVGGVLATTLNVPKDATLTLDENSNMTLDGRNGGGIIHNAGVIDAHAAINAFGSSTALTNDGTIHLHPFNGTDSVAFGWSGDGASMSFHNAGTIIQDGENGSLNVINALFENSGTIEVRNGSLRFRGTVLTHTGTFRASAGSSIDLGGNSLVVLAGSPRFLGEGRVQVSEAEVTMNGLVHVGDGGEPGTFDFQGGRIRGILTLINSDRGTLLWSGGELAGIWTIPQGSALRVEGGGGKTLLGTEGAGILHNNGSVTLRDSAINGFGGTTTAIYNTGTFTDLSNDVTQRGLLTWSGEGTPTLFQNTGTLIKAGGTGQSVFIGARLDNQNRIEVQKGSLALGNGESTLGGTVDIGAGASFDFYGMPLVTLDNPLFMGEGKVRVDNAGAILNGTARIGGTDGAPTAFEFTEGELGGSLTLAMSDKAQALWNGGSLTGTLHVPAGSRLNVVSGQLNGSKGAGVIENDGSITVPIGSSIQSVFGNSTAIRNRGTFDFQTGDNSSALAFSWNDSGGGVPTVFDNQAGGILRKSGGNTEISFNGVNVANAGTVEIQKGTLDLRSGYTQAATGRLELAMGGPTPADQFGRLNVEGSAVLDGDLNVRLENSYRPNVGDVFEVVDYTAHTGNFRQKIGLSSGDGLALEPAYEEKRLVLTSRAAPVDSTLGDANLDGTITIQDAVLVLQASIVLVSLTADQTRRADMNQDGKVNVQDALLVLRKAAGLS